MRSQKSKNRNQNQSYFQCLIAHSKKLLVFTAGYLLLSTSANSLGTTANTQINFKAVSFNIQYVNSLGYSTANINASQDLTDNVEIVSGFTLSEGTPGNSNSLRNQEVNYLFTFFNKGNLSNTLNYSVNFSNHGQYGDSLWAHNLIPGSSSDLYNNDQSSLTLNINIDTKAFNGSYAVSTVNVSLVGGGTAGSYTGFNNNIYGGLENLDILKTTTVLGPEINLLSKTVESIIAPTPSVYGYQGDEDDGVPGAIIQYSIEIQNSGSTLSALTRVVETIPTYSIFYEIIATQNLSESGIGLGASGDVDYYYSGGWNASVGSSYAQKALVEKIRFNVPTVNAGSNHILLYQVTIKGKP